MSWNVRGINCPSKAREVSRLIKKIHIYLNFSFWSDVAMLKNLWSIANKKDRLGIRCVNDDYIRGHDVFHYKIPIALCLGCFKRLLKVEIGLMIRVI